MAEVTPNPTPNPTPAPAPAASPGNPAPAPASGSFAIPDAYKDKAYLKDVKDYDGVFKMLDGAQSMIGKYRAPKEGATEAEMNAYYKDIGRPEKFEDYQFEIPDAEKATRAVDIDNKVKKIFHDAGISQAQVKKIQPAYDAIVREQMAGMIKAQNDQYDALATKLWGDKRKEKEDNALKLLSDMAPPEAKFLLQGLPNEQLLLAVSIVDSIKSQFQTEDPKIPRGPGNNPVGETEDQLRSKAREIMGSEAFNNPLHPDHSKVVAEKDALYAKIRQIKK